jgi:hypothetical protein
MQRVDTTTVLVVPWYERKDFEALRRMSQGNALPPRYETWLDNAFDEMRQLLSTGCALKIVTLHLDDYFAWLKAEDACDSTSARMRYLKALAEPGSNLSGSRMRTDAPWPGFPLSH